MEFEELMKLLSTLAEGDDGTHTDSFAVLKEEITNLNTTKDAEKARADNLELKNGELKKENFRLFSRVGSSVDTPLGGNTKNKTDKEEVDEDVDYLKGIFDEKGRWK